MRKFVKLIKDWKMFSIKNLLIILLLIPLIFTSSLIIFSLFKIRQIQAAQSAFSSVISSTHEISMVTSKLLIRQKNIINANDSEKLDNVDDLETIKQYYRSKYHVIRDFYKEHKFVEGDEISSKLNDVYMDSFVYEESLLNLKKEAIALQKQVVDKNQELTDEIDKYNVLASSLSGKISLVQKRNLRNINKAIKELGKALEEETDYLKISPLLDEIKEKVKSQSENASSATSKINLALAKISRLATVVSFEKNLDNLRSLKDNQLVQLFSVSETNLKKLSEDMEDNKNIEIIKELEARYKTIKDISIENEKSLYSLKTQAITAGKNLQDVLEILKNHYKAIFENMDKLSKYNSMIQDQTKQKIDKIIAKSSYIYIVSGLMLFLIIFPLGVFSYLRVTRGIKSTAKFINQITDHDLSARASVKTNDELGAVLSLLNNMTDSLVEIIEQIKKAAIDLNQTVVCIESSSKNLNNATSEQQQQVSDIKTKIETISSSSENISICSNNTNEKVNSSLDAVKNGKDITLSTTNSINELLDKLDESEKIIHEVSDNSTHITGALDVINSISEQTNLLALNAAIEAARAGDAGRGFSVVADEVRALATKSRISSDEIRSIIETLRDNALKSVESMSDCKGVSIKCLDNSKNSIKALEQINLAVSDIKGMTKEIENFSQSQKLVVGDVSQLLARLTAIEERINSQVQENMTMSVQLKSISNQLTQRSDVFTL